MPKRVKSSKNSILDAEKQLKDHAKNVYSRTVEAVLSRRRFTLVEYLDGEIGPERSREIREELMTVGILDKDDGIELMESGAVPDLVIKDKNGVYAALIEVTSTSTIEVRQKGIISAIEKFARVWERERKNMKVNFPINEVVQIVEVY